VIINMFIMFLTHIFIDSYFGEYQIMNLFKLSQRRSWCLQNIVHYVFFIMKLVIRIN